MGEVGSVIIEMFDYYSGDSKRVQHFVKVHSFAKLIGEAECLDERTRRILEISAVVHDIGIKVAEVKYGNCDGKLQEKEGPAVARELLGRLNIEEDIIERICYLVGHHHTYTNVDGMDYQILIEADFLVNIYEDELSEMATSYAYNNIFKTKTGKEICKAIYKL